MNRTKSSCHRTANGINVLVTIHSYICSNMLANPIITQDLPMAELRLGQHANFGQEFGRNDQLLLEGRLDDEILVLVLFMMR